MIETTIRLGDILQILALILAAIAFYYGVLGRLQRLLENHAVRLKHIEELLDRHDQDIRDLYKTKTDRNNP